MSTFRSGYIRRWQRAKVQTFAEKNNYVDPKFGTTRVRWNKHDILSWIDQKSSESDSWNQSFWDTYHSMKTGGRPAPSVVAPQVDENKLREAVQSELHANLANVVNAAVSAKLEGFKPETTLGHDDLNALKASTIKSMEALVREELKKYQQIEIKTKNVRGRPRKMKHKLPPVFKTILELASQRVHVMMVGPTGSGKTFLAERVAEAFNLDFAAISCSAGMSESKLEGSLLPTGKAGAFEYWPSTFVQMYEEGGVFLLDEVDASDPNTLTFINAALAGDHFFVEKRFDNPEVVRHPDFICLAAANTWGQGADAEYVGREQLDAATLNRFAVGMVEVDYDREVERSIIEENIEEEATRDAFIKFCWTAREACTNHNIRRAVSTRFMKELSVMVNAYKWNRDKWEEQLFRGWSRTEVGKVRDALVQQTRTLQ